MIRKLLCLKSLRHVTQVAIFLLAFYAGLSFLMGWSLGHAERYCPMGGLATSFSLLTNQTFTCATGEWNVAFLLALLFMALVVRRSFCSWLCPVGSVGEWLGMAGKKLHRSSPERLGAFSLSRRWDRALRWVRLPVLFAVLLFTFVTAELIFRPYCPFYVLFAMDSHDLATWSYPLAGALLGGMIFLPMAWCRYLCPLGGALWPFARFGRFRITRKVEGCTSCRLCEKACPYALEVSAEARVDSGDCTLCLECVEACPEKGVLGLSGKKKPVSRWTVPLVIFLAVIFGVAASEILLFPSYERQFAAPAVNSNATRTVRFTVDHVRCVDTARTAADQLEGVAGVIRFTAYASRHRVDILYDAAETNVQTLRQNLEKPIHDREKNEYHFHPFKVLKTEENQR